MSDYIQKLLETHGPCLSSELIDHMVREGVSHAAARQRITRAGWDIKKLAGLRFPKNTRFLYLDHQYGTKHYWAALERSFKTTGKGYWGAVVGLKAKGGFCPKFLFPIACGAPQQRKSQLSPEILLERLKKINFLEEYEDKKLKKTFIKFKPSFYTYQKDAKTNAVLLAEYVALHAIKDWARRIGFGSFQKFKIRDDEDELPIVSAIAWDMSAPSYMRPLVSAPTGKIRPGFFVCDINLNGETGEDQVDLFIRKHDMASAPARVAPIMPFLVANHFSNAAFDKAKAAGILAVTVENLFGVDIAKALDDLIKLLTDTGATASVNPEHLEKVMSELTKIEGAANNLRGDLFELVIGSLVKRVEIGYLKTGEEYTDLETGKKAEIDVLLDKKNGKTSFVLEARAKLASARISLDEAEKWYTDRIPLIERILRQDPHYQDRHLNFELWTNGTFHPKALAWLKKQNKTFKQYSVNWKEGAELKAYAQKCKNKAIRKMLNEHYFKNPLSKI